MLKIANMQNEYRNTGKLESFMLRELNIHFVSAILNMRHRRNGKKSEAGPSRSMHSVFAGIIFAGSSFDFPENLKMRREENPICLLLCGCMICICIRAPECLNNSGLLP